MITGTYTTGKSDGIYLGKFDLGTGNYASISSVKGIKNPSFLCFGKNRQYVYAVSEANGGGNGGKVFAYAFDMVAGQLKKINEQPSGGDDPCHLSVDGTGKWLAVGNYSSGSLSVLPIAGDGSLGTATDHIVHQGQGADKTRQEAPHVHETVFSADNRFLYVPDLGLDRVYIYAFDARKGKLKPAKQPFVQLKPATGPRHILFHPTMHVAYVLNELNGSVNAYRVDVKTGSLTETGSWPTLPKGASGPAGCAELQFSMDKHFLYCSNRYEENSLAIYAIDGESGALRPVDFPSVLGRHPRYFTFDPSGEWLLVANKDTDEIVLFRVDEKTGMIKDSGKRIPIPSPVCMLFTVRPPKVVN